MKKIIIVAILILLPAIAFSNVPIPGEDKNDSISASSSANTVKDCIAQGICGEDDADFISPVDPNIRWENQRLLFSYSIANEQKNYQYIVVLPGGTREWPKDTKAEAEKQKDGTYKIKILLPNQKKWLYVANSMVKSLSGANEMEQIITGNVSQEFYADGPNKPPVIVKIPFVYIPSEKHLTVFVPNVKITHWGKTVRHGFTVAGITGVLLQAIFWIPALVL